jgi:chitodextrinase
VSAFALTAAASGADNRQAAAQLPAQLWPVAVGKSNAAAATTNVYLQKLRRNGVNALVLDASLKPAQRNRLQAAAKRNGLMVVQPVQRAGTNCIGVCALNSLSATAAVKTAKSGAFVVLRLRGPRDARYLKGLKTGRVLVVPVLTAQPRFDSAAWKAAIASARLDAHLDLAVAPTGTAPLNAYLSLLSTTKSVSSTSVANSTSSTSKPPSGSGAPAAPKSLTVLLQSSTSLMVSWKASARATQYGIYRDGALVGSSTVNSAPVTGLTCGTGYTIEVDAVASSGARSARVSVRASTSACPGGGVADTTAPTAPAAVTQTAVGTTTVTVMWGASLDNVGVTRYDLYKGGAYAGTSTGVTYALAGLACGTSYVVGVEAVDAAGNRSARTNGSVSTAACVAGDSIAPSTPSGLSRTSATQTSVTMSWTASTDNVAVTGYGRYRNGALVNSATGTSYTFTGLACGTSYTLGVDAYDAVGNRSATTSASASTSACSASDTSAPTAPASVTLVGATSTSISVSWPSSSDNVGVAGYGRYRNGTLVTSTTGTTYTFTSLTCSSTYTLGIDAYDAAGNRSATTTLSASTSACPAPGAAATRYVSPGGSDSGQCTQAAPCGSFMRAYAVASAGDTVEVAAGSYPMQTMTQDSSKTSGSVTFRPASGATVTVSRIQLEGASYLTFRDLTVTERLTAENSNPGTEGSHDILFENLKSQTFRFVGQVSNITVRGGEFGTTVDNQPQLKKYNQSDPDSSRPYNILIEGNSFHDFRRSGSTVHTECLQIINADTVTVRKNRFNVCDGTGAMGITDGPTDNLTIENNFFGKGGDAYYAVQITKSTRNLVFRNNSLSKGFIFSDTESGGPYAVTGNYSPHDSSTCTSGATYRYNVFAGGTCGATDLNVASLRFVDENGFNLHLRSDSEAIGRGDPTSFPTTDIDGDGRPNAGAADAGADEF